MEKLFALFFWVFFRFAQAIGAFLTKMEPQKS